MGIMVAKIGWDLGWRALSELVDTALDDEEVSEAKRLRELEQENLRLKAELKRVEEERDILKKAAAYFAKASR